MAIKLKSYSLSEDTVSKMILKIEETKQKKIELGFGLCHMKHINTLKPGRECSGDECSMTRMRKCSTGSYVGGYHTHPTGSTEPSIVDLKNAYINDVECIGSVRDGTIRCFIRIGTRNLRDERNIISRLKEIEESLSKTISNEQYRIWKNSRDEILTKHFHVIDVK